MPPPTSLLLVVALVAAFFALATAAPDTAAGIKMPARPTQPLGAVGEEALIAQTTAEQAIAELDARLASIVDPAYDAWQDDDEDANAARVREMSDADWWAEMGPISLPLVVQISAIAKRIADGACDSGLPIEQDARCLEAIHPFTPEQAAKLMHLRSDALRTDEQSTCGAQNHTLSNGMRIALPVAAGVLLSVMGVCAFGGCLRRVQAAPEAAEPTECAEAEHAALLVEQRARALVSRAAKRRIKKRQ